MVTTVTGIFYDPFLNWNQNWNLSSLGASKKYFFVFNMFFGVYTKNLKLFLAVGIGKPIFTDLYTYLFSICLLRKAAFFFLFFAIKSQIRKEIRCILYT